MPSVLSYPGVYIEEVPSGVRTITGVSTSIAAFVGYTRKGKLNTAIHITSFADFERSYGGLDRESPVSYAVSQFFMNGGTEAYVVRVTKNEATANGQLEDDSAAVLNITASSPGLWGNDLRITIEYQGARNPDAEFNLIISQLIDQGGTTKSVLLETHRNLNLNPNSRNYVVAVIKAASQSIQVALVPDLTFDKPGYAISKEITFPLSADDYVIAGTVDGITPFKLELETFPYANLNALVTAIETAINNTAGLSITVAKADINGDIAADGDYLRLTSSTPGASSSVTIAKGAFSGLSANIGLGLANGGREFTGDTQHRPASISSNKSLNDGLDGIKGDSGELIGSAADAGNKTGIKALLDVDLFNILSIPETRDLSTSEARPVIAAAVDLCEKERAFYIVDAPSTKTLSDITSLASEAPSRNAAVYFPAILASDPLDDYRQRAMAPSGAIAGVYARTDSTRGIWKAPAGTDATLKGVAGLNSPLNDIENGTINVKGVNALRNFPTYGKVVWGARTMRGADSLTDEYKYVPVRRLALYLEESLYRGTQWVVFEPNDEPLWAQIRLNIGSFMQNLFRQGAFQGSTPKEAYLVKCDRETTTQNDINSGIVNILVGFAPLKPAEFVVLKIQQMAGQVEV